MRNISKEIEELSSKFHDIYQQEAARQAELGIDKVRHPDKYEDLPERTKEYDRVLARYVIFLLSSQKESIVRKVKEWEKNYEENAIVTFDKTEVIENKKIANVLNKLSASLERDNLE